MLPCRCSFSVTLPVHSLWLIVAYIFATSAWRQYSSPYQVSVLSVLVEGMFRERNPWYNALAVMNSSQGEYAQSEQFYQRALAIRVKTLRTRHLDIVAPSVSYAPSATIGKLEE